MSEKKKFCEECGSPLAAEDRFCPECGASAPEPPPLPSTSNQAASTSDSAPASETSKPEKKQGHEPEESGKEQPTGDASPPPSDRYCEECGESLGPEEKFCQECGAPALEDLPRPIARGADQPISSSQSGSGSAGRPKRLLAIGGALIALATLAFIAFKIVGCVSGGSFGGDSGGTTLKLNRQFVQPGTTATVPVWLVDAQGIKKLHFLLSYDSDSLELSGEATPGSVAPDAKIKVAPGKKAGTLDITISDDLGITGTGALLKIPFKVTAKSYVEKDLRITVEEAADQTGSKPSIRVINGEIVVGGK